MSSNLQLEMGKIVGSLLLMGESVTLPEVGTLYVVQAASRRLNSSSVLPPRRTVDFSSNIEGLLLTDQLAHLLQCSSEEALAVYQRWLAQSRKDNVLTILGVGELRQKSFVMEREFAAKLNPQGVEPVEVAHSKRMPWWEWSLLSLVVVALVVVGGWWLLGDENQPFESGEQSAAITPSEQIDVAVQEPVEQLEAEDDKPQEVAKDSVKSVPAAEEPKAENIQPQTKVATDAVGADQMEINPTVSGMSYVVLGIFSTESNARRAVAQAVKRYTLSESECRIFNYGSKFLVSLDEQPSREEAQIVATRYRTAVGIKDVWVYTKK